MTRRYPDEPAGTFPAPPRQVTDSEDRSIQLRCADGTDRTALIEMYKQFDPADRAQGIPPARETAIERWLENILDTDRYNVVASHEGDLVGHATLVPDEDDGYELAIFVLSAYQGAGIGTELVETLLGHGQSEGIEQVWLTVERWNDPAIALYRKVGFETSNSERFEQEMSIRLA
ncbi:GNAT family N-acetyltransferase [Halomicrobium sp. LC1Hm]|uniref:GNAT family N-acetyltransferase n=1 Tax=Halomicrobium sp. LC1Hm TaxID=2610902 RepID=UPI00129826EB|nr:GNAT family N-acetyltransferase [Halomicrobium sp. LC1Hm]QGA83785.1 Acetyltransferase (GNAT) family [Halomicrobium sp. LC1Hm]